MVKKNSSANLGPVVDFIFEAGLLKRVERSGWSVVGMKQKESVAEHSFRCAIIGYLLASLEGADSARVMLMTLFGDMHEARITDLHKMAQRYVDVQEAESAAFTGQINHLPGRMRSELAHMRQEYTAQETKESIIARDADILECLIQAKEYYEFGFRAAAHFMKKAPQFLVTASARGLWKKTLARDTSAWWRILSDFKRQP